MNGFYETGPTVKVGDRYRDLDKRTSNRVLEVTKLEGNKAVLLKVEGKAGVVRDSQEKRIRTDRLLTKHLFEKVS